ncbi:MAG: LapA family protein [Lentisphaeria bacterium]|nr:LapA family protein [Lentisphaeria bacterium]
MKKLNLVAVLVAVVLGLVVILQNTRPVEIRFLFLKASMSNAVLLGITLLVGIAIGILLALIVTGKRKSAKK